MTEYTVTRLGHSEATEAAIDFLESGEFSFAIADGNGSASLGLAYVDVTSQYQSSSGALGNAPGIARLVI